jgi:hypothetical protein
MEKNGYEVLENLLKTIVKVEQKISRILRSGESYSQKKYLIREELQKLREHIGSVESYLNKMSVNTLPSQDFHLPIKAFCEFERNLFNKILFLNIKNKDLMDLTRKIYDTSIQGYPFTKDIKQLFLDHIDDYEEKVLEDLEKLKYLSRRAKKKWKTTFIERQRNLFFGMVFVIANGLVLPFIIHSPPSSTEHFFNMSTDFGFLLIFSSRF